MYHDYPVYGVNPWAHMPDIFSLIGDSFRSIGDFFRRDHATVVVAAVDQLGFGTPVVLPNNHSSVAFVCGAVSGGSSGLNAADYYWQAEIALPPVVAAGTAAETTAAVSPLSDEQRQAIGQDVLQDPASARPVHLFVAVARTAQSFGALCAATVPVAGGAIGYGLLTRNTGLVIAALASIPVAIAVTKFTLFGQPLEAVACKRARRNLGNAVPPHLVQLWWRDNAAGVSAHPVVRTRDHEGAVQCDLSPTSPAWAGTVLRMRAIPKAPL